MSNTEKSWIEMYQSGKLEEGYYLVNQRRFLYWDGKKWMKPVRDVAGRMFTYVTELEKEPKVKSIDQKFYKQY